MRRLGAQFTQLLVVLLMAAAIVSAAIGENLDAIAIGTIVLINGLLGFVQEFRAEKALRSLRAMSTRRAHVLRSGGTMQIDAERVVPGDVLVVGAGETVAADARLFEEAALRTDEALLTGESTPVQKGLAAVDADADLGDRSSVIYQGTLAIAGRGRAIVVATGARTEMGKIAASVALQRRPPTPLQERLERLGRILVGVALLLSLVVLGTSLVRGLGFQSGFFTAVSLSVAAVPEGLPAATTIVLALGVQRMAKRHALMRRLSAVETLGSVTVIAVDKTGTLTENSMRVAELWMDGRERAVEDATRVDRDLLERLLAIAALCNDAGLSGESIDARRSDGGCALAARRPARTGSAGVTSRARRGSMKSRSTLPAAHDGRSGTRRVRARPDEGGARVRDRTRDEARGEP